MFKTASTKNKLLTLLSIILTIFIIIITFNIYIHKTEDLNNEKIRIQKSINETYSNTLENYENYYKARLEGLLHTEGVFEAFINKDREKLYNLMVQKWKLLKKENKDLKIMHFHLANGKTLLRMHNPALYDDDIAKKRPMLAYVHKEQKFVSGYEAGIHLLGYRVIKPVFYNGKYLGAVELGCKPKLILEKMEETKQLSGLIFSKNADIFNKKLIDKTKLKIDNYTLDSGTKDKDYLVTLLPKDYKLDKDIVIEKNDKIYAVYIFSHTNFKGKISSKTIIFNDITTLSNDVTTHIRNVILFSLILYIISLLTVKLGFERVLDKMDKTTKELQNNIASLTSHQLAMDESSIVTKSDLEGNITYVNDNFIKLSGYSREEAIGKPHSIMKHPSNNSKLFENLWKTIQAKKVWKGVLQNRGKYNDYWINITILPILDKNGGIIEYIAVRQDITKVVNQQQRLKLAANTDSLTGYGSRYKLNKDIANSTSPALAILDVDNFSQINDFYGHDKGDIVIKELGKIISEAIKKEECELYHLQGDEYVLFNGNISKENFIDKMVKLASQISKNSVTIENEDLHLNWTISISCEKKNNILSTADMGLKVAKKENKNIIVYSDDISLNDEYKNNIKWARKIKNAIESNNIVPVFQPIVNNKNGAWEKYESLARLKDDDGALITPYFFLDISKKTKHYTQITKIMLKKSFDMFKEKDVEFSVNLTIDDILNDDIKTYLSSLLESYKIGPRVVLEIVESESIENFKEVESFINFVRVYGCKIAIDDFGTGYSNFEYLMKLKADYIKIDGSMIKDINTNKDAEIVVSTIVDFAKKMNIKTIAEFVEDEDIYKKVKELGIDYSQGYYFSKPELNTK